LWQDASSLTWLWQLFREQILGQSSLIGLSHIANLLAMRDSEVEELFFGKRKSGHSVGRFSDYGPAAANSCIWLQRCHFNATQGMAVQIAGLRQQVDPTERLVSAISN